MRRHHLFRRKSHSPFLTLILRVSRSEHWEEPYLVMMPDDQRAFAELPLHVHTVSHRTRPSPSRTSTCWAPPPFEPVGLSDESTDALHLRSGCHPFAIRRPLIEHVRPAVPLVRTTRAIDLVHNPASCIGCRRAPQESVKDSGANQPECAVQK